MKDEDNLEEVSVQLYGKVNEVFTSNDSILKLGNGGGIYGENCIGTGEVDEYNKNDKYGAFSVEFSTNSEEIVFGVSHPIRIFVDEGGRI